MTDGSGSASPTVFWFRRDLRLADNPALAKAAAAGPVLGLFVIDPTLWNPSGANRQAFLLRSLDALSESMDGRLCLAEGEPADVVLRICHAVGAERVVACEDFGPYGRRRDRSVAAALEGAGLALELLDSPYAVRPDSIVTGGGTPYKVFTPFFRAWTKHGWAEPTPVADVDWSEPPTGTPTIDLPAEPAITAPLPAAGEDAAWERFEQFLVDGVQTYGERRDLPAEDGTSRLSPYLKWGIVHPRQLLDRLGHTSGEETFRSELCWRDFYAEVLYQRPDSARQAYVTRMGAMEVDEGPEADARFEAWTTGQTGYPIVDAGMRQLLAQGWMHNRVRMIVASFLVKDLHIDWFRGARHFMDQLVDGDLASNNHGWQWVAGTGTDASPYFRIFNPITQSKKFDPQGRYLREWLPEIAHLPDRSIHAPWTEKTGAPAAYPLPIVDHDAERAESLARYDRLKLSWA